MEQYLYAVSRVLKTVSLEKEMVDECLYNMESTIKHSTRVYFDGNPFYEELS